MDDSTSNPSPSLPPIRPRSLLDLPTELLSVIVKICADQDEAFRHRVKLIKAHYEQVDYSRGILEDQAASGFGSSLDAISRLCHRIRALAAPYIFKTLKASRTNLAYRCYIAPQYQCHFQHAYLDTLEQESANNLVTSLASLPNLHELTLDAEAANAVYGNQIAFDRPNADRPLMNMLLKKGRDIRTLHLRNFSFLIGRPRHYIEKFPNLRSLSIVGSLLTTSTMADSLAQSISRLEDLKLDLGDAYRIPEEFLRGNCEWPKLKKLSIISGNFEIATLDFIRIFESSLQHLSITTPGDDNVEVGSAGLAGNSTFPLLDTIAIIGSSQVAWQIFGDSNKSTFPSLIKLRLSYNDVEPYGFGTSDNALHKVFDTSTIRFLQYDPPDQDIAIEHKDYLRSRAEKLGFRVKFHDCPEETFPTSQVLPDSATCVQNAQIGRVLCNREPLQRQIKRVRKHLNDSIKVAQLTGNLVEYQRILNLARPLEYDRLAKLD